MGCQECLASSDSDSFKAWALIEFASWYCASDVDLTNTISGTLTAVKYLHRLRVGVEQPVTVPVVQCAIRGIARAHVTARTLRRVRSPVYFGRLPARETLIPTWIPAWNVLWLCLCPSYFLMT